MEGHGTCEHRTPAVVGHCWGGTWAWGNVMERKIHKFICLFTHLSNNGANIEVIANQGICEMLSKCKRSK